MYAAVAASSVTLAVGAVVLRHLEQIEVEGRRRVATDLARGSAFAIEQQFARSFDAASVLAAMVEGGASSEQLDRVAVRLLEVNGSTANLQLARDCIISHLWPLRGNEAAKGLDLLHSAIHGPHVREMVVNHKPTLYGPFSLVQGGEGLALRVPVIIQEGGNQRFWGLSSSIVRFDALLRESRVLNLVAARFDYQLRKRDGNGKASEVLASSLEDAKSLADPVDVAVSLLGQEWVLSIAPRGGWSRDPVARYPYVVAALLSLLVGALTYRISSQPELLRRQVAARTAELEVAHREQRRAEEAQRQSQKLEAIGQLAGGVAHDFNNLLAGILGWADLLLAGAAPGSETEEAAKTISQAAHRAAELTRQLLALARLGHQRRVPVDAHVVVREVAQLLVRTLDKSIHLKQDLSASEHHVLADPSQLQQVILNLAVNARDAMPGGGTLSLKTVAEEVSESRSADDLIAGRYLVLSVTDTGMGIPVEYRDRIFEPFFTTKPEGRGSGLGLATVYGIVKGHGGVVRVQSEVGAGARFSVYLPLVPEERVTDPRAPVRPRGTGWVLIVDDEEIVRRTTARMASSLGYQAAQASDCKEALDWLSGQTSLPVAMILDIVMPDMDGVACFRLVRSRYPRLPVLITSGFSRNDRAQVLLNEGAALFLQKPYTLTELAQALAEAGRPPPASA